MVVGITIATVTVLLLGGKKGLGSTFIDPESLREPLEKAIAGSARRQSALGIVDAMTLLAEEYDDFLRGSLDEYLRRVSDFDQTPAKVLEEVIAPVERKRRETLLAYVGKRDELRRLLQDHEWIAVFGEPQAFDED